MALRDEVNESYVRQPRSTHIQAQVKGHATVSAERSGSPREYMRPAAKKPFYQKPLRGYLKSVDLAGLEQTKELLYGQIDIDGFEADIYAGIKNNTRIPALNNMNPGKHAIDKLMRKCRNYLDDIA